MGSKDEFLRYLRSVFATVLHAQVSHSPYCILVTPLSYMDHPEVAYPTIMSTHEMAATKNMAPARPRKSISWTLTPEFTVGMLSGGVYLVSKTGTCYLLHVKVYINQLLIGWKRYLTVYTDCICKRNSYWT